MDLRSYNWTCKDDKKRTLLITLSAYCYSIHPVPLYHKYICKGIIVSEQFLLYILNEMGSDIQYGIFNSLISYLK